jgi:anti-sigma regulatory factor (Ser/Thr protein kinase)
MSVVHPLDKLEATLSRDTSASVAAVIDLDFSSALEFAALRWVWWSERREDLLGRVLGAERWSALVDLSKSTGRRHRFLSSLPRSSRGLEMPQHGLQGVQELPRLGSGGWDAGGTVRFFQDHFRGALVESGVDRHFANALAGAMVEMASNAVEHADSPVSPLACFEVSRDHWNFGVVDVGKGVLESIKENPIYASLNTSTQALSVALQDGVSRTGQRGRGYGFRRVFKALVDRRATLRFRSGGVAGAWEGESPTAQSIIFRTLPVSRPGFFVKVAGPLPRR